MARPMKEDDEARSQRVAVRLTLDERAALEAQAAAAGISVSAYARSLLTGGSSLGSRRVATAAGFDDALVSELNRLGVRLHQLLERRSLDGAVRHETAQAVSEVRMAIFQLIENGER